MKYDSMKKHIIIKDAASRIMDREGASSTLTSAAFIVDKSKPPSYYIFINPKESDCMLVRNICTLVQQLLPMA